jgi:UDP-N-acetylmuramate--alanine ligase
MTASCFLCGIGGSGMSALAQMLLAHGYRVSGSDRSHDRRETPEKFAKLAAQGIMLYPQDGSGVSGDTGMLIVSSAVEDSIPDVRAAREKNIPIRKRAEILAELFDQASVAIAVGGTSGKSTTTAMIGWILEQAARHPTIVNGALMNDFQGGEGLGNAVIGSADVFVAEVDESDGSIALFHPSITVLTNITLDHKPLAELRGLFGGFLASARQSVILNLDDPESSAFAADYPQAVTFALENPAARFQAANITPLEDGVAFAMIDRARRETVPVALRVPGRHNVANAMAALAAAHEAGVSLETGAAALAEFHGIRRRFEMMGTVNGITVIDDFAHNPDKIAATLATMHEKPGHVWAIFQPHGFGPTKLMRRELTAVLQEGLLPGDTLVMPEIYYAGGTASRDISSADIVRDIAAHGHAARFFAQRADIPTFLAAHAQPGDRIIIMGARDDTLPAFAREILAQIMVASSPHLQQDSRAL